MRRRRRISRLQWLGLAAVGLAAWSLRRKLAARIPGTRAHRARLAAGAEFLGSAATRMVAVGIPDHRSVRIWLRTDRPGEHTVELITTDGAVRGGGFVVSDDPAIDGTAVVRIPDDTGGDDLQPDAEHRYIVRAADGTLIGSGRFTTAPRSAAEAGERIVLAIASCHQPFEDDGTIRETSLALLDGLPSTFARAGVSALMLLGDQMYTDLPAAHSLFDAAGFRRVAPPGRETVLDCTRAEVRAILQRRYRAFWKIDALQRLQADLPTLCMLDDHELVDNFGSDPVHASPQWAEFVAGALDAFHDYQGLRAHDRPRAAAFPTMFEWGPLAALVLDLRAQRNANDERIELMSEDQWRVLDRFLDAQRERPVLMLGLTVPLLHVPEWVVTAGSRVAPAGSAAHERWAHPLVRAQRDRLTHRLLAHRRAAPQQRVILVSGDVHVGTVCEVRFDGELPMLQVVSSALSNLENVAVRVGSSKIAELGPEFETAAGVRCSATLLPGRDGKTANPHRHLNAGLIELQRHGEGWQVRVRLLGIGEGHDAAVMFDSGPWPPVDSAP